MSNQDRCFWPVVFVLGFVVGAALGSMGGYFNGRRDMAVEFQAGKCHCCEKGKVTK